MSREAWAYALESESCYPFLGRRRSELVGGPAWRGGLNGFSRFWESEATAHGAPGKPVPRPVCHPGRDQGWIGRLERGLSRAWSFLLAWQKRRVCFLATSWRGSATLSVPALSWFE
jgi:hypothetical protein